MDEWLLPRLAERYGPCMFKISSPLSGRCSMDFASYVDYMGRQVGGGA